MTTPEQLAKWREEFESKLKGDDRMSYCSTSRPFVNKSIQSEWQGHLRAKQETEQAMKLAKFGAMVIENLFPDDPELFADWMVEAGLLDKQHEYTPKTEATIKELLND